MSITDISDMLLMPEHKYAETVDGLNELDKSLLLKNFWRYFDSYTDLLSTYPFFIQKFLRKLTGYERIVGIRRLNR